MRREINTKSGESEGKLMVTQVNINASNDWQMLQAVPLLDEITALSPTLNLQAVSAVENIVG